MIQCQRKICEIVAMCAWLAQLLILATSLSILISSEAFALLRIEYDIGGRISTYIDKYTTVRDVGDEVIVDGLCLSACTILLGVVPQNRICITDRAIFGFHAAWIPNEKGYAVYSEIGTQVLWQLYPGQVRKWIAQHGGLQKRMIYLHGNELTAMYPECR